MDFIKKMADGANGNGGNQSAGSGENNQNNQGGGDGGDFGSKIMGSFNNMAGGGKQGEENEDGLDKAVDFVQEKFLGKGDQSNESAAEQAKDEAISDFIRDKYKETTGKDFFVADKDKKYGA